METELTGAVIGAAIEVHRQLGPGLLESTYEACLCYELAARGVPFLRQVPVPVVYHDVKLDCGYRVDLVAGSQVVVELKSVAAIARSTRPNCSRTCASAAGDSGCSSISM
jgi:GxxExxY protein